MTQPDQHEQQILSFVRAYRRENSRSPSYQEICRAVGLTSKDHVARDLRRLKRQGALTYTPGVSRSIVPLKGPRRRNNNGNGTLPLPAPVSDRLGPVASTRDDFVTREIRLIAAYLSEDLRDVYVLQVRPEASEDALLGESDLILVKHSPQAQDGDMVAVWLKSRQLTMLKYIHRENGQVRLQSPNPNTPPEYLNPSEIEIRGRVLAIVRQAEMANSKTTESTLNE